MLPVMAQVAARRRSDGILEGTLGGQVDPADVEELHRQLKKLLEQGGARVVIVDTSAVSDFSPQVRVPGVPFLADMKASGVSLIVAVAPSALVRMMGSAIGVAAGIRMQFVKDTDAAVRAAEAALVDGRR